MIINNMMRESKTYRNILEHRRKCPKWSKEFCMECFGGGLTKFSEDLIKELKLSGKKNKILSGCGSENGSEIDGREFDVQNLTELVQELKSNKQVHLNYFEDESEDLDLWVSAE